MFLSVTVTDAPVCSMSPFGLHDGHLTAHYPQTMEKVCVFAAEVFFRAAYDVITMFNDIILKYNFPPSVCW